MALVMLGGPYWRGRERALEARQRFAEAAACVWGGQPAAEPGLTFPEGDWAHYADAARQEGWPGTCLEALEAVAPAEVFWLFPDTRHAEGQLRRAVAMVRRELEAASGPRAEGAPIPARPRLAFERLAAALGVLCREADARLDLDAPAIAFQAPARSATPERVPLRAAREAELEVRPWVEGAELLAIDRRGISWVRVAGGRVDQRRLRRPRLVARAFRGGEVPWLLWRMDDARCAPDCSHRASGLAPLGDETVVTPEPIWLEAHPVTAQAVAVEGREAWIVARGEAGPELRRFTLDDAGSGEEAAEAEDAEAEDAEAGRAETEREEPAAAPLAPVERWALPGAEDPQVRPGRVDWWHEGRHWSWEGGEVRSGAPGEAGWARLDAGWLAWSEGERVLLERGDTRFEAPSRTLEDVLLRGGEELVGIVGRDAEGIAWALRCAAGEGCGAWARLGPADALDATAHGDRLLVAWSESEEAPQIRVRALGPEGWGEPQAPAACFSEGPLSRTPVGFCGRPSIGSRRGRVVLVAREGSDALVLESRDGRRFEPLHGLR
ncbi:MAG: hypothetical protein CMN29_01115 [Sandaracinus sp.]|nr:hypothetical protein [Sandaracinus sp.]